MLTYKLIKRLRNDEPGEDGGGFASGNEGNPDSSFEAGVGTGNDARVAMLERINDANDGLRAEELASINDDGSTSAFDATTAAALAQAEAEANQLPADEVDPNEGIAPQAESRFKIKVNGREIELTQDELIARAQKIEAADQYIAEAARIRRDAETEANRIQQQVVTPQGPTAEELLEERRAAVRAIQMGTEEEAMAALEKLSAPRAPALNADDLARTVDERLTFNSAIQRFQSEYQDVLGDPVLKQLALQKDQQQLAQGDKRDYWTRFSEIGNELRGWKQGIIQQAAPPAAPPATTALQDKAARKAQAPQLPKATAVRAPAVNDVEDTPESTSDVIAAIAKARGGPQWARA
jgi:hypothetical protein